MSVLNRRRVFNSVFSFKNKNKLNIQILSFILDIKNIIAFYIEHHYNTIILK